MTRYFADAFYYLALLNPRDEAHERAVAFTRGIVGGSVTTAWVLTEVGDALSLPPQRRAFLDLLDDLRVDPEVELIAPSPHLFERGVTLYRERSDKSWTLTDCISFVSMQDRDLREALTADHHFEQAGFVALLK